MNQPTWRSPEEIVEIGFQRAPVVMMNEAHNGWKRCIRTRQIGKRILPVAHDIGIRYLTMEALYFPSIAEKCNATHHVPEDVTGYPAQPETRDFIQSALDLGWTLISYEANPIQWLNDRHNIELSGSDNLNELEPIFQSYQAELASMEFTNWREEQQALNLIATLQTLPANTPLLVWCGNSHQSKRANQDWIPMGYRFQQHSSKKSFAIDQTRSVKFESWDNQLATELKTHFSEDLAKYAGTAGFLMEEVPSAFKHYNFQQLGNDAFLLSIQNQLE